MKAGGVAKKVWQIIKIALMLIRKGISMKKILLDLNLIMKRGKIAGKSHRKLHHDNHHGSALKEYEFEFSCNKNNNMMRTKKNSNMEAVDRVLERIISLQNNKDCYSHEEFHGFGDQEEIISGNYDDNQQVDEAAEEFIKRFYSQLKLQPSTPLLN